jgi:hypothetical protein
MTENGQIITIIDGRLNGQGRVIVEEARRASLDFAVACALVEQESGGRNIFGCDHGDVGDQPPYCNQEVTQERVQALIASGDANGVGLTQLTYPPFVQEAEDLGGAHIPANQCRVGFRILKDYVDRYPRIEAFGAYNAGEANRFSVLDTYAAQVERRRSQWEALLGSVEEVPETIEGEGEGVTEYEEVTLRADERGWLYRENTDPKEWAKTPDLQNAKLATNGQGWVYADAWVPGETVEPEPGTTLEERIQKVTEYNLALVAEEDIEYSFWHDGECINTDGPPAFGVDGPAPTTDNVSEIFCAGVGNLDLRLLGKPVPKNTSTSCFDGGTRSWSDTYGDAMIGFDLNQAEEGDVAFRPFQWSAPSDQGHWAYVGPDQGAGNICIQSWPFAGDDSGMNASYTIEESHDGGFYFYLLKAKDWLGD